MSEYRIAFKELHPRFKIIKVVGKYSWSVIQCDDGIAIMGDYVPHAHGVCSSRCHLDWFFETDINNIYAAFLRETWNEARAKVELEALAIEYPELADDILNVTLEAGGEIMWWELTDILPDLTFDYAPGFHGYDPEDCARLKLIRDVTKACFYADTLNMEPENDDHE
jgi:hypothetical protein